MGNKRKGRAMKDLKGSDRVFIMTQALRNATARWGDEIPVMVLADISSACLAIATERLEDADRLPAPIGKKIVEP
jgi:hypothetical protein